jgi:hypothetical protein
MTDPGDQTTAMPVEPAGDAVAATSQPTPVTRATAPSRGRWLLAFGVAGLALVVAAAAIIVLGNRPTPEALRYIPADMGAVAELRMDLPGDQLQKVGNLLAHFPGFKDQSTLTQKLDESLDRIAKLASGGSADYVSQVKPWLAGPTFAGVVMTQAPATAPTTGEGSFPGRAVIVFTTDGKVTCQPFVEASTTTEAYRGIDVRTDASGKVACALDGRYALAGDPASVKAALDAHADHKGIDTDTQYRTARDALGGDRLATLYLTRETMLASSALSGELPGSSGTPGPDISAAISALPAWTIFGFAADDAALVADVVTAPAPTPSAPAASGLASLQPPHPSRLAGLVPADTAALLDVHSVGPTVKNALAALRANPSFGEPLGQLDAALGILGGPDALVGWIEDVGIVVVPDGTALTGGVLLMAADEATATAKAAQIKSFLTLAGIGGGIDIHEMTINGTTVTIADLGDLSTLLSQTGQNVTLPPGTRIVLSVAARGSAVMVGIGESFARRILETAAGTSLADQASYKAAIGRAFAQNLGQMYIGTGSLLPLVAAALPESERTRFTTEIQPYLAPLDAVVVTITSDASGSRVRLVATVK